MNRPDYIEQRDNGYWILGTRVSLDSVVYRFLEGLSPETIQADCFPTLTLDQVYGAISYYLTNRAEIDRYLRDSDEDYEAFRQRNRAEYSEADHGEATENKAVCRQGKERAGFFKPAQVSEPFFDSRSIVKLESCVAERCLERRESRRWQSISARRSRRSLECQP